MAWYRAGTVTVTNASPVVTGSGTSWLSNLNVGDMFTVDNSKFYEVLSVDSDTQITLVENYAEGTQSGISYAVVVHATVSTTFLATKITDVVTKFNQFFDEHILWQTGPFDGGENNDGVYPLTSAAGTTVNIRSLPRIEYDLQNGGGGGESRGSGVVTVTSATPVVINCATNWGYDITMQNDVTFSITPDVARAHDRIMVKTTQGALSTYNITWPAGFLVGSDTPTTGWQKTDVWVLTTYDSGTTWCVSRIGAGLVDPNALGSFAYDMSDSQIIINDGYQITSTTTSNYYNALTNFSTTHGRYYWEVNIPTGVDAYFGLKGEFNGDPDAVRFGMAPIGEGSVIFDPDNEGDLTWLFAIDNTEPGNTWPASNDMGIGRVNRFSYSFSTRARIASLQNVGIAADFSNGFVEIYDLDAVGGPVRALTVPFKTKTWDIVNYRPWIWAANDTTPVTVNLGQSAFTMSAPTHNSGYRAGFGDLSVMPAINAPTDGFVYLVYPNFMSICMYNGLRKCARPLDLKAGFAHVDTSQISGKYYLEITVEGLQAGQNPVFEFGLINSGNYDQFKSSNNPTTEMTIDGKDARWGTNYNAVDIFTLLLDYDTTWFRRTEIQNSSATFVRNSDISGVMTETTPVPTVLGIEVDLDTNSSGQLMRVYNATTGTQLYQSQTLVNPTSSGPSWVFAINPRTTYGETFEINFGQSAWVRTPTAGHVGWPKY